MTDLFENIPEDWRNTHATNIESLIKDEMYNLLPTYAVFGGIVQHGVKVTNVNKHAIKISFTYKQHVANNNDNIIGVELNIEFIVNLNKTIFRMHVISYQIYNTYYQTIRMWTEKKTTLNNVYDLRILTLLHYTVYMCERFKYNNKLQLPENRY